MSDELADDHLAEIVARLARVVPHSLLKPLLDGLRLGNFKRREEWAALSSSPKAGMELLRGFDAWQATATNSELLDGKALSFGLQVAIQNERWRSQHPAAELVWSGPKVTGFDWRQTESALLQIIESAQKSLWLVTFAAYHIESLASALHHAAERGVIVHFVGETQNDSDGKLSLDAAKVMKQMPMTHIYHWPREKRLMDGSKLGVLHAKCAVTDARLALVSSANFTDNAMHLNMEIGVLLHGEAALRLQNHLEELVLSGIVQPHQP